MIYLSGYLINNEGAGAVIYNIKRKPISSILILADGKNSKLPKPFEINIPRMFKYPRKSTMGNLTKIQRILDRINPIIHISNRIISCR